MSLLLAPDLDREKKRANRRFAQRPPRSLEEELAWQREVQLRADADRMRAKVSDDDPDNVKDRLLKAAFAEAVRTLGRGRLEHLLGRRFRPGKRRFSPEEARILRGLLSGVDSESGSDLYCAGHAK